MTRKKYSLIKSDAVTTWDGRKLFRIKAAVAIGRVPRNPCDYITDHFGGQ